MRKLLLFFIGAGALLTAQTAKFPGAVATDQDLLHAYDRAGSTLSSGIDSATLTIPVADGSSFALATYFSVSIDAERILICSVSGNTLTACSGGRGYSGSTAASHLVNATVRATITAWHHNTVAAEVKAVETALGANLSNIPSVFSWSGPLQISGSTVSCPTCVATGGSYSDPLWLTISKSKVGLGSVENTALSTWTGSANITTLGTISSGTIPAARVSGAVATASALAANGSNCPANQFPKGMDASGNAESCAALTVDDVPYIAGQAKLATDGTAVATATWTWVTLASVFDTGSFWSSSNPTRLTAPASGYYLVIAQVGWWASSTGARQFRVHKNRLLTSDPTWFVTGNTVSANSTNPAGIDHSAQMVVYLAAGDYLELEVYQTSGGNLQMISPDTSLTMVRLK